MLLIKLMKCTCFYYFTITDSLQHSIGVFNIIANILTAFNVNIDYYLA